MLRCRSATQSDRKPLPRRLQRQHHPRPLPPVRPRTSQLLRWLHIEGFEHAVKGISSKDYIAKGIDAIQQAARSGKFIAFTIGSKSYRDTDMDAKKLKTKKKKRAKKSFQDRFDYALALFLICAEKHSYFLFTDSYSADGNWNKLWKKDLPEYSKPLGPPQGPATKNGYLYKRTFQHAQVEIDIEKETATILWRTPKK